MVTVARTRCPTPSAPPDLQSKNILALTRYHCQVVRYRAGEMFGEHTDYFERDRATGIQAEGDARSGQRVYTGFAYLNEGFEGGHTRFPLLNISVKPVAGALLMWKNVFSSPRGVGSPGAPGQTLAGDPRTVHSGDMVSSGEKLACNIWVTQRPHDLYRAAHDSWGDLNVES